VGGCVTPAHLKQIFVKTTKSNVSSPATESDVSAS
jgi:hypothetical protein